MKKTGFATIILAGGKGTRMGSSDKHKVCFEVLGVPVIIRALETYNLCGAAVNIVVVGMMAESVMGTVSRRFPATAYAFQDQPLGTGDAARKGSEILERAGFAGNVLVVAGDKVIDPRVLQKLLTAHERAGADATLATMKRPAKSSAGILLRNGRGNIVGILEEAERQRLEALGAIARVFNGADRVPAALINELLHQHCDQRAAKIIGNELWDGNGAKGVLLRTDFEQRFSTEERAGSLTIGAEAVPAARLLDRCDQINLSTYVFRAPILYEALARLRSNRASQEEYLTDVFGILAAKRKKVIGWQVENPHDLMAFNNPQELLAIEEVFRQRQGESGLAAVPEHGRSLAPVAAWANLFEQPSATARSRFRQWYGETIPWGHFQTALQAFRDRYGNARGVSIIRSPGRINLMGRHIDHQGGTVNVMAVNREIILVAAPREDDLVRLANRDGVHFTEQTFRISDLVASVNWDDWQRVIDGPRLQRMLEAARGDWANYVKAAILRLQELFRDRQLRGLEIMVSGDIPMGAGLSSSSALVVAAADAVRTFNQLPVSARRLVSLCGEGEWFVG
ncbi:MAG TPA: galactokinase family protein, partial [Clostridia bacterium]|nr:galactokinase family protein [Clostridia bacterium]